MSGSRPRSHRVAQAAYERVKARKSFPQEKDYGALAHQLPTMILQNGLAQATGFLLEQHLGLLDDLTQVLRETGMGGCDNPTALRKAVVEAGTLDTMHLTRRALEAAEWIKRFVQGVLEVDAAGQEPSP